MNFENLIYNLPRIQKRNYKRIEKIENKILKNNMQKRRDSAKIYKIITIMII